MKDNEFLMEVIRRGNNAEKAYFEHAHIVACYLNKNLHEQLFQLINGPVYDGDIISKSDRGKLFDLGLAVRTCVNGSQGYTGATYFAFTVNRRIQEIKEGKVGA